MLLKFAAVEIFTQHEPTYLELTNEAALKSGIQFTDNIRPRNAICRDEHVADVIENIGLKLHFYITLYRFYYQTNAISPCVIIF